MYHEQEQENSTDRQTTNSTRLNVPLENTTSSNPPRSTQLSQTQPTISSESSGIRVGDHTRRNRLEAIVEDFRNGVFDRCSATSEIIRELGAEPLLLREEKDKTFGTYIQEINSIADRYSIRGEKEPLRQRSELHSRDSDEKEKTIPRDPFNLFENLSKRGISEDPDSDDEGSKSRKKLKLLESEMPWSKKEELTLTSNANPSCLKTINLLKLFNRDIKQAKFYISIAPEAPGNIPSGQWERILKGEPVDLDQILSSIHRITTLED